jgi:thymidylate kinase
MEAPDRIEREGTSFLTRVREGYLTLTEKLPEARLIQAQGSPLEVQEGLRRVLMEVFPETFPPEPV